MRKQLKLLLLVATVVALFAMAMIVGSAATHEAGTPTELTAALTNATAGDTIKLTANIEVADAIEIKEAITIDGNGNTITYTGGLVAQASSTVKSPDKRGVIATYGSTVFRVFADFTVKNATLVFPHNNTTGGLFTLVSDVAFKAENITASFNTYLFTVSDANGVDDLEAIDTVGGAQIEFVGCDFDYTGTTPMVQYSHRANPANVTFSGCEIDGSSVETYLLKIEETVLTLHSCKIDTTGILHHCDSQANTFKITGSGTVIKAKSLVQLAMTFAYNLTIGEEGQTYDMDIQCTNYVIQKYQSKAANVIPAGRVMTFTIHSGTFKLTGADAKAMFVAKQAGDIKFNIKNATLISDSGKPVFLFESFSDTVVTTAAATVADCTIQFAGVDSAIVNVVPESSFEISNTRFIVTARPVVYENQGTAEEPNMVPTNTPVALFSGTIKLEKIVILAPGGTVVNTDITVTPYAQAIKYKGVSYKIWYDIEGELDTKTTTSIYVDTAAATTSGIRFNTAVGIWDLVDNFAGEYGFDDTNIFEEVDGYKVNFYTVVAPLDYVVKAGGFTEFTTAKLDELDVEGAKCVKIKANNTLAYDADTEVITYSGALIDLKSYTRVYAAIAMFEVVEVESGEVQAVAYGNFETTANAHSAQEVAIAVQGDEWTTEQKAIVDAYASGVKA